MSGRSKGSNYQVHLFTADGRVEVVNANNFSKTKNIDSERIQRTGTTESEPDTEHNGWSIEAEFDREEFALDDVLDARVGEYHDGVEIEDMELVETISVPKLGGASRTYRYTKAAISDYSDDSGEQNDAATISVTFETGKRVQA